MFAEFLAIETEGAVRFTPEPKWGAIERAIRALDGTLKTLVCIEARNNMHMDVASGANDRCAVACTYDNESYYVLTDGSGSTELVEVTVAGITREYPVHMLVPREVALVAAKTFAEKGEGDPSLHWMCTADAPPINPEET